MPKENQIMGEAPLVAVVMGSASDSEVMQGCIDVLQEIGIPHEVRVLSAHRTPDLTREYVVSAADRGIEVIIGFMASHTVLPVIGVPIDSSVFKGMDALLSTVQMPPGIPVATVAVGSGGAKNAAVLAAQILALKYPAIDEGLKTYRENLTQKAAENTESWKK
jgi:phosphoribosylaminoimidazole carboxylase PurE protein